MGSKPVKSGEGVVEVKYDKSDKQRDMKSSNSHGADTDSYGARSTPQSATPPPTDALSVGDGKGKARKGFTYSSPEKHRRDCPRETKMMNDHGESIDAGFSFRREKVQRVPTRAVLKPPKNKDSLIADPDDDNEDGSREYSVGLGSQSQEFTDNDSVPASQGS